MNRMAPIEQHVMMVSMACILSEGANGLDEAIGEQGVIQAELILQPMDKTEMRVVGLTKLAAWSYANKIQGQWVKPE